MCIRDRAANQGTVVDFQFLPSPTEIRNDVLVLPKTYLPTYHNHRNSKQQKDFLFHQLPCRMHCEYRLQKDMAALVRYQVSTKDFLFQQESEKFLKSKYYHADLDTSLHHPALHRDQFLHLNLH